MTVSRFRGRYWSVPGCFVGLISAAAFSSRAAEALFPEKGQPAALLAPKRSPAFREAELTPLLEVLWEAPIAPVGWRFGENADSSVFESKGPVAATADETANPPPQESRPSPAAAPPLPIIPPRSESPAPDPHAAAMENALAWLILQDGPVNPLGEGDWRAARAAIGAFYADRRFEPVFVDENGLTDAGQAILHELGRAAEDGLDLRAVPLPRDSNAPLSPADVAAAEVAMAAAVVVYAEQASGARVSPLGVSRLITLAPAVADPGLALAEVAAAPNPAARLADFNPPQNGYRALREKLKRLTEQAADQNGRALASLDDARATDAYASPEFGAAVETPGKRARALKRKSAYAASANPARLRYIAQRRAAILANMEMWRWEPRDMGKRRIEVNVPDFSASLIEGDTVVLQARVVVGKPNTPTPIFSNVMRYVLINPSWQVPDSIIRKEMLPKVAADPDYFVRHGYQVSIVGGRLTVRQPPGEDNALGRLAFMFPNDHSVYMHDTPSQRLFDAETRAFSHGCIRVEGPVRLAELVLGWPESRITGVFGGRERTVFLPRPLPIHIEYFTEFVDELGELRERGDVYGITRRVADRLSKTRQD